MSDTTLPNLGLMGRNAILTVRGRNGKIQLGRKPILGANSEVQSSGELIIGENLCINKYSRIISLDSIQIGDNVLIAQFVSILDHDHKYQYRNNNLEISGYNTKGISIGNNVWIGDKVSILKGVTIGDNVIIGANSVVSRDIGSNVIVAGSPAIEIRKIGNE